MGAGFHGADSAAAWAVGLAESSNDVFFPLFFDTHRYLVLMGGAGSGKSIFAGRKILERAVSEPGHRILVCRKVARTIRDSCYRQLEGQLAEFYPDSGYEINRSDLHISFPNGSEVLFAGLDNVDKLKSIYNITAVWVEEASDLDERDFDQLDIRLRGKTRFYKQVILTFNPVSARHWLKRRFFDREDPRARVCRSTYRDNRFLDAEAVETLERLRDVDEYYYRVYCLGQWGVSGRTVFPAGALSARLERVPEGREGELAFDYDGARVENVRFVEGAGGNRRVFDEPEAGAPYVIGVDTAGEGSDWAVAQVLDNRTGAQAAVMRVRGADEDVFARCVAALGIYYNRALVGVECNFSTYTVRELERLRYGRQYVRSVSDGRVTLGFLTTSATRPVIIAGLIAVVRDDAGLVRDRATLEEMLTFVRTEAGRAEAERGSHDDCVMALAIAHYIRGQQRYVSEEAKPARRVWTRDMREDYWNADEEGRRYLLNKWGDCAD